MNRKLRGRLALLLSMGLVATACGSSDTSGSATTTVESGDSATTAATEDATDTPDPPADEGESADPMRVAYFGYSNVNGFTQGIWTGVQEAAAEAGAEADLFDGEFDGSVQADQIQNAIISGEYDVFVISANNGAAIIPAVEEAIAEGIAVTAVYSAIGPDFLTLDPQIDGMMFVGTPIAANGTGLGEMAIDACADRDPCYVSYLIGFANFPLDDARTAAFEEVINAAPNAVLVDNVVGGYDQATGQEAADGVFLANDQIDVMVGSAQAILGAEQSAISNGIEGVSFIGNGSPTQAVTAVKEGRWYGVWVDITNDAGRLGASLGLDKASGGNPPASTNLDELTPVLKGTAETLGDFEGQWTN